MKKRYFKKAVYLFWNKGFNNTSMQDLVEGLAISRSSMYDTFGNKHQLYLKALKSDKNTYVNQLDELNSQFTSARDIIL